VDHATLSLDYGAFTWMELSSEGLARLAASGVEFTEETNPFTLRLGEQSFDPKWQEPVFPAGLEGVDGSGPDLHLVQFVGPTRDEWLAALDADGLRVVQYIHPHTYIVWGEPNAVAAAAGRSQVRWTGSFAPAYRLLPNLRGLPDQQDQVRVLLYRGADTAAAVQQITALGGKVSEQRQLNHVFDIVGVDLSTARLADVARIPGVYSVQVVAKDGGLRGEMSNQVNANNVDGTNLAFPGYLTWLGGLGLNGAGVIIANVDGGVQNTHPDLTARFVACSGSTCGGAASSGHGTHTAGIMAADGTSGTLDGFGFLRGLGVAPGANLVEQVYSPWYTQPGGMLLLMTDSYNNGASLSGNSWGPSGTPLGYDNNTMQVDIGVRDADPQAAGNQPLSFVLSFMNGNGGTSTQGTPDEAKNIFNIGSTKMQNSNGSQILQIDDLSSNTAHGPALDGRTIPHMVAPGCNVDSTYTTSTYSLLCGTSMASPHVSGAVALFIEYYRSLPGYVSDPSPAMVKAAFLPVAHDLAGHLDADGGTLGHPFDSKQGWGRMDLEAVLDPQVSVRYWDNPQVFDNTGEEWVTGVAALDPSKPLKLMLVWTDAPGHGLGGSAPAWNNNLDLEVQSGAGTYRGNVFGASGWSVTGGSADIKNNTEGVFIGPTATDSYTIRVVATNINSDAIPNSGDNTDQDFVLVCYNCAEEPGFTLAADPTSVEICAPDDAVYNVNVGSIMGFTNPVTLSASGNPAGTTVNFDVNPVSPPGGSVMTLGNTGAAAAGSYSVTIQGDDPITPLTRTTNVTLKVSTGVPAAPSLTSPSNGATDVSLAPMLSWSAAAQAASYLVEVATDAGFSGIVFTTTTGGTGAAVSPALDPLTEYFWRVRASNICGDGSYSSTFSFTTRDIPGILLVDDDDNAPDVRAAYTDALTALGVDYDLWNTNNTDNEPDFATLSQYQMVIWFTGDEFGGFAGPGAAGEAALASFLNGGGCLFISAQDYLYDRGLTSFLANYLGVSSYTSDVSQTSVTGTGSVFTGFGPYALSYPFTNYSDTVQPTGTAEVAFVGNVNNTALDKDTGLYRTTFWTFPFEAVPAGSRPALLDHIIGWCGGGGSTDCNENGVPDYVDIGTGTSEDCNENGTPDECEIDANSGPPGTYFCTEDCDPDCNHNGIPDACDQAGQETLMSASFESGLPVGWTATGLWHTANVCGPAGPCDGTNWAYFGQNVGCNFSTGATVSGVLTAPAVTIPAEATLATLSYCSAYGGESGNSGTSGYDWAWLAVNGVEKDDVSAAGDQATWETRTVDLSSYAGQTITLTWNFNSVDSVSNSELGWVVDAVEITLETAIVEDCNGNTIWDACDIDSGFSEDCQPNGIPDECDIDSGGSEDANSNGIPDECEAVAPTLSAIACCSLHGAYSLCLDLPQGARGGALPIEPRRWQPGDTQEFEITLSGPAGGAVTVAASCSDGSSPAPASVVENSPGVLTVQYTPPLPNTECCTLTLSGGATGSADVTLLYADVTRNGAVNSADKNVVAAEIGTFANTSAVFWYDVDRNNAINSADRSLVNAEIGTADDPSCP